MATITDDDLKMFQERAKTEFASRCDTGGIAWDSVIWDLCNEVRRLRSVSKERGDCAKLREALCEILSYIESFHKYITPGKGNKLTALFAVADTIRTKARAALAAPPRNCDVGTAEEQTIRFKKFCLDNRTENDFGCGDCPCYSEDPDTDKCTILWAQLPYESEAAK